MPYELNVQKQFVQKGAYLCMLASKTVRAAMFLSILVGFFSAACECIHKSLVNAFPRSDLVRGNVS